MKNLGCVVMVTLTAAFKHGNSSHQPSFKQMCTKADLLLSFIKANKKIVILKNQMNFKST